MHKADRTEESLFEIADVNDLVNTSSDFYGVPMIKTKHTRDVVPIKDDYTMGSFERTILRPRKGGSKFRC